MKQKKPPSYFLTTPRHVSPPIDHDDDIEFSESDIVWSHSHTDDVGFGEFTFTAPSPRGYTAGISAAILSDSQQYSPTSVQRKMTTSSPVSMISPSPSAYLSRSGGPGFGFGPCSAPVNIPVWPDNRPGVWKDEDEDDEKTEMVPPHEIVAKSFNNNNKTMSFSINEGVGRKLKGRDLTKLRNSVFVKTGFLD